MISKESLERFKKLYYEKYKITLSDEAATQMATDFLSLMKILTRPEPKNKPQVNSSPEEQNYEIKQI